MKRGLQQIWVVGYFDMAQIGYFHTALCGDFRSTPTMKIIPQIQTTDVTLLPPESPLNTLVSRADLEGVGCLYLTLDSRG